jgi:hypothetical protein
VATHLATGVAARVTRATLTFRVCGSRGNVIRGNRFENIVLRTDASGAFGNPNINAVYFDDTMSGWTVHNNTFTDVMNGVLINGGRDNVVTSNHFVNTGNAIYLVDECPTGKIQVMTQSPLSRPTDEMIASSPPPHGVAQYSALIRAEQELKQAMRWPAWRKYGLVLTPIGYPKPTGDGVIVIVITIIIILAIVMTPSPHRLTKASIGMCSAGGNRFVDNSYCQPGWPPRSDGRDPARLWPFCKVVFKMPPAARHARSARRGGEALTKRSCKGFTPHQCTNTSSVFRGNVAQCS